MLDIKRFYRLKDKKDTYYYYKILPLGVLKLLVELIIRLLEFLKANPRDPMPLNLVI